LGVISEAEKGDHLKHPPHHTRGRGWHGGSGSHGRHQHLRRGHVQRLGHEADELGHEAQARGGVALCTRRLRVRAWKAATSR
jgi:hypothetical protein